MKKYTLAAILTLLVASAFVSTAQALTPRTITTYERTYHKVAHKFGKRAPGRNIVRWGLSPFGRRPSEARVLTSLAVLRRMLRPVALHHYVATTRSAPIHYTGASGTAATHTGYTTGGSWMVRCIIRTESGGNSQVVNASGHMGLGQWAEATWLADGGGRYAATPLGASYDEQLTIIEEQVALGHTSQWTPYDGC